MPKLKIVAKVIFVIIFLTLDFMIISTALSKTAEVSRSVVEKAFFY